MALLAGMILAGCTSETEEIKVGKEKEYTEEGLGNITDYGEVTIISEAEYFVLEENESLSYELADVKIIKLENYTEQAEFPLTLKHGVLDINEVPASLYMVIGTEKMKNKTDSPIVFSGAYKMKEGNNRNVSINTEDILFDDGFGAVMVSGADYKSQFAAVVVAIAVTNKKEVTTRDALSETAIQLLLERFGKVPQEYERSHCKYGSSSIAATIGKQL